MIGSKYFAQLGITGAARTGSRSALAAEAKVGKPTIVDFERDARSPHASTRLALRLAFEAAGIEFIDANGGGPGVRFREAQ